MELTASQLVKLYMQSQIVIGYIYYAPTPEARLLDALNGLADIGPVKRSKFIELNDATINHGDGTEEKIQTAYINKSTIQVAITLGNADAGRGIGAQPGIKSYPYIEKLPVPVRVETQSYIITGNMHRVISQRTWHVLEDSPIFLPLTHSEIYSRSTGVQEKCPFVAVNKEHILSLQEEEKTAGRKVVESGLRKELKRSLETKYK
jgi:hypothetical protein